MDGSAKSRCWLAAVLFSLLSEVDMPCPPASGGEPPRRVRIGDGSGYLSYPEAQVTLKLQPGETLYINPGTYSGLSLGNLSGTAARPITVQCDPDTVFTTTSPQFNTFPNIAHVRFVGFRFETYKSTCLKITGRSHDVLFQDNNISWEKRKYPMYEHNQVQQADLDKSSGYLSPTSSEVCFNTLFRSRKAASSKDPYVGMLVDVYGPDVTIKHNLVIEPEADVPFAPTRNYVVHLGAGPQAGLVVDNNPVFPTWAEAGLTDTETFRPLKTSPARDAATGRIGHITEDHYHHDRYRDAAADVGAVEGPVGE